MSLTQEVHAFVERSIVLDGHITVTVQSSKPIMPVSHVVDLMAEFPKAAAMPVSDPDKS
jgi:hypothetical protein